MNADTIIRDSCQTILFDLDGTLLDTTHLILTTFEKVWQEHFGISFPYTQWNAALGRPLRVQFSDTTTDADEIQILYNLYQKYNTQLHDSLCKLFQGVMPMLEVLHTMMPLGIVSSKTSSVVHDGLRLFHLEQYFDVIIGADDFPEHKPNPGPLLEALRRMNHASPDTAMYIGDSPADIQAGQRAGMLTGAALWGPNERSALLAERPAISFETPHMIDSFFTS